MIGDAGTTTWTPAHGGENRCPEPLWHGERPVSVHVHTSAGVAVSTQLIVGSSYDPEVVPDDARLVCRVHGELRTAGEYRAQMEAYNREFDAAEVPSDRC